ncbi:MAG: hypothetical protein GW946_01210 [Candidatus Pacebacteria bacterium]|nr:hypothetical protein [Candidatus Paceibacterota bacterium]PIR60795.1 MAG: hypothetical protein COU67_00730 [Candidatus Pacebacteria bacterium CG10_big_fil_rev_8_21_14_0_10_44_54]
MIAAPASTYSLNKLEKILDKKRQEFSEQFDFKTPITSSQTSVAVPKQERDEIFAKLETVAATSAQLSEKESLYLEQQVSDLLGFEISSELEGKKLTHTFGKIQALDEFSLQPHTTTNRSQNVRGAHIQKSRPSLGWGTEDIVPDSNHFLLANHLPFLQDWHQKYAHYKRWYKWKKLLLINPFNRISVVVELAAATLPNPMQYQFGGSPDLIRASQAWSPQAQGLVCVFFIPDAARVNPGVHKV